MSQSLAAAALLDAWDAATTMTAAERPAVLLAAAYTQRAREQWERCPLGERDAALLRLREALFGAWLETTATCPSCGEGLEMRFRTTDVTVGHAEAGEWERQVQGMTLHVRAPSQRDVIEAIADADPRRALLRRCVRGEGALDDAGERAVVAALAELDPQADVRIGVRCPACEGEHELGFDIAAYLWEEIDDWARTVLAEVHVIASAYGWGEGEILALSALRRRSYLEMLGS